VEIPRHLVTPNFKKPELDLGGKFLEIVTLSRPIVGPTQSLGSVPCVLCHISILKTGNKKNQCVGSEVSFGDFDLVVTLRNTDICS
jgi:hypothetical protein